MPTYESLPAQSPYFNGKLFQQMVDDLRLAGKAKRTVYGFLRAVRKLADFCRKCPDQIREQNFRRYPLHLIVELEVATGTCHESDSLQTIRLSRNRCRATSCHGSARCARDQRRHNCSKATHANIKLPNRSKTARQNLKPRSRRAWP